MKIKNYILFLATFFVTIFVNFWQPKLVQANEGKIIREIIEFIAPELGKKGVEYIFSLIPVQIFIGIVIIIVIIWGISALISYISNQ